MAPLIECILGQASTPVGDETYNFNRDKHGRYVAHVDKDRHVELLVGLTGIYREVEPDPAPVPTPTEVATLTPQPDSSGNAGDESEGAQSERQGPPAQQPPDEPDAQPDAPETPAAPETTDGSSASQTTEPAPETTDDQPGAIVDDVTRIDGLGKSTAAKLEAKGIVSLAQIAAMTPEQLAALDKELGLRGLSERSQWIEQARALLTSPE